MELNVAIVIQPPHGPRQANDVVSREGGEAQISQRCGMRQDTAFGEAHWRLRRGRRRDESEATTRHDAKILRKKTRAAVRPTTYSPTPPEFQTPDVLPPVWSFHDRHRCPPRTSTSKTLIFRCQHANNSCDFDSTSTVPTVPWIRIGHRRLETIRLRTWRIDCIPVPTGDVSSIYVVVVGVDEGWEVVSHLVHPRV